MSLISKIREHSKLLVGILVTTMLGFAAQELIFYFVRRKDMKQQEVPVIAEVGHEKIFLQQYTEELEKIKYNLQAQYGAEFAELLASFYGDKILNNLIDEIIYSRVQDYGFGVGPNEMVDLIQGNHVHEEIQRYFKDPKTGEFNREKLMERLQEIAQNPEQQRGWSYFEQSIGRARVKEKVQKLFDELAYLNTLDLKWEWDVAKTRVDLKYLFLPYDAVNDEDVKIEDSDLKKYYKKYGKHFRNKEEENLIHYMVFNYEQSPEDSNEEETALNDLSENLKGAEDPESFAETNTDGQAKNVLMKFTADNIPDEVKDMKVGEVKVVRGKNLQEKNKIYRYIGKKVEVEKKDEKGKKGKKHEEKPKENFEFVVIEQNRILSDEAKNKTLELARSVQKNCVNIRQFDDFAKEKNLDLKTATIKAGDKMIGNLHKVRDFIHWVFFYDGNKCREASEPFATDKGYIVGFVEKCNKKGVKPFDEVKEEIHKRVLQRKKHRLLKEKIAGMSLDEIVQNFPTSKTGEAKDLEVKEQNLGGKNVKYAIFRTLGLEKGESSQLLADEKGCWIFSVLDKRCEPLLNEEGKRTEEFLKFCEEKRKKFVEDCRPINEKAFYKDENVKIFKNEVL